MLVVLDAHLRSTCSHSIHEAVSELTRMLSLDDTFVQAADVAPSRIGCLLEPSDDGSQAIPYLHDRMAEFYNNDSCAYAGGFSTTADLCRFYESVVRVLSGEAVRGLPSPTRLGAFMSHARPSPQAEDQVTASGHYAAGFMIDLPSHGLIDAKARSFGHIGFVRTSLGYHEPESGITLVGIVRNADFKRLDERQRSWSSAIAAVRSTFG